MSSTSRFLYRIVQASSSGITAATATIPVRCAAETQTSTAPVSAEGSIKSKEMQPNSSEGNGIGSTADRADPSPSSSNGRETNSSGNQEPPSKRPKLESSSSPSDNTNCDNPDCDNPSGKAEKNRKEVGETREIKGVIFDMDGTLTLPVLNFIEMRRELKIPVGVDILPTVLSMPAAEKDEAMKIIEKWEEDGTRNLQLQPGAVDLLQFVAGSGVRRALMTRNGTVPTQVFLDRIKQQLVDNPEQYPDLSEGTVFEEVLTRDFRPVKPDPAAVLHICKCWSLKPWEVAVVGDDKTDMICGKRAGVGVSILLKNERNRQQEHYEDFAVDSLAEVLSLFSSPITVIRDNQE